MYTHYPDFVDHEMVTSRQELGVGLSALIAIHNTRLGPAIGGCRIFQYRSMDDAVTDVLRLSRGMTYKTAIAQLPYGGGKAVIIADPHTQKNRRLLHAMGDFVESLNGRYITSFDSGTTLEDVRTIGERTRFAAGTMAEAGNASASTAYGVCQCIKVAARSRLGHKSLEGVRVAVQGLGNVGSRLAEMLHELGAILTVADLDPTKAKAIAARLSAEVVSADEIHRVRADVFSPNALGGILSVRTIPEMTCKAIVGGQRIGGYDELRRFFGLKVKDPKATSYTPVIAVFAVAAVLALALSRLTGAEPVTWVTLGHFTEITMCLLAMLKLQDVDRFATMFLGYDLLARRYVPYAYFYPFAELAAGALMLAGVAAGLSIPLALLIGSIGALSVFKAVYIDRRELKCACVGGSSNVPLGFVSLTENLMMIAVAIGMLLR